MSSFVVHVATSRKCFRLTAANDFRFSNRYAIFSVRGQVPVNTGRHILVGLHTYLSVLRYATLDFILCFYFRVLIHAPMELDVVVDTEAFRG
jgi:hypothetical protein